MSSKGEQIALEVCPKVTGTLSIIGSIVIIIEVLRLKKNKRQVIHHILLLMSIADAINSFAFFLATWPIPKPMGKGNIATCDAQGFVIQIGLCIPFWNALLATSFLAKIRWGWNEEQLRKRLPLFHFLAWTFPFVTAVACLILKQYNDANLWCWIAPIKDGVPNPDNRGVHAGIYQMMFFYVPLWIVMVYVCVIMYLIYQHVHHHEQEMKKVGVKEKGEKGPSHRVRNQALCYSAALLLTWIFGTMNRVAQLFGANIFGLMLLHSLFVPAQGFFNFLVYKYPKHGYIRKRLKKIICCSCCCSCITLTSDSTTAKSSADKRNGNAASTYVPTQFPLVKMLKNQIQSEESGTDATNDSVNKKLDNSEYMPTTFRPDGLEIGKGIMDNEHVKANGNGYASDNDNSEYIPTTFRPDGLKTGRGIMYSKNMMISEKAIGHGYTSDEDDSEYRQTTSNLDGLDIGRNMEGDIVTNGTDLVMPNEVDIHTQHNVVSSNIEGKIEGQIGGGSYERDRLASDATLVDEEETVDDTERNKLQAT